MNLYIIFSSFLINVQVALFTIKQSKITVININI